MRNDGPDTSAAHRELAEAALAAFLPGMDSATGRPVDFSGELWHLDTERTSAAFLMLPDRVLRAIATEGRSLNRAASSWVCGEIDSYIKRHYGAGLGTPSSAEVGNALAFADLIGALDSASYGLEAVVQSLLDVLASGRDIAAYLDPRGSGFLDAGAEVRDDAATFLLCGLLDDIAGAPMQTPVPKRTKAAIRARIRDPRLVVNVIRERKTLDPDAIVPLLDAPVPAIADGHL